MTRRLPKSINPCPITEAIVEIRFDTDIPRSAVFGMSYSKIKSIIPGRVENLPISKMPEDIFTENEHFKYLPHHRVIGDGYIFQVGPQMISFSIVEGYTEWSKFKQQIKSVFDSMLDAGVIDKITRLGLRYINIFDWNILPELNVILKIGDIDLLNRDTTMIRTLQRNSDSNTTLVVNNGIVNQETHNLATLIDIDVEQVGGLDKFESQYPSYLEKLHAIEKDTFFGLLTDEFIETLKPEYEEGEKI